MFERPFTGLPYTQQQVLHDAGSGGSFFSNSAAMQQQQQQQLVDHPTFTLPGMKAMHCQQQYHGFPENSTCSSPGASSCLQHDEDALMDFWVLLQQTQHNLQVDVGLWHGVTKQYSLACQPHRSSSPATMTFIRQQHAAGVPVLPTPCA